MGPTIGPICPIQPLTPITEKAIFHNFEATAMYEGSKLGYLRVPSPSRPSPGVPRVPVHVYHVYQVLNPLPQPLECNFWLVGATEGCEGSKWGFLGDLNPTRPSPGIPRVPVHVYHVYQLLHPLPHPKILTFDWEELQKGVRCQNWGFWGCWIHLDHPQVSHVALCTCTTCTRCSTHCHIPRI